MASRDSLRSTPRAPLTTRRRVIGAVAALSVAASTGYAVIAILPDKPYIFDLAAQASHWAVVIESALVVALFALRRFCLAAIATAAPAALLVAMVSFARPHSPGAAPGPTTPLRVVSFNALNAASLNDRALYDWIAGQNPDLVAVIDALPGFGRNNEWINRNLPYRLEPTRGMSWPIVLLSRHPIETVRLAEPSEDLKYSFPAHRAVRVALPSGARVILTAVHPYSPRSREKWATALRQVERDARVLANATARLTDPIIVAADQNSTPMGLAHRRFRAISGLSTRSSCFVGTWPSSRPAWLAFPIDRVWVSPQVRVSQVRVGPAFRSDHRPIVADLLIPTPPQTEAPARDADADGRKFPEP